MQLLNSKRSQAHLLKFWGSYRKAVLVDVSLMCHKYGIHSEASLIDPKTYFISELKYTHNGASLTPSTSDHCYLGTWHLQIMLVFCQSIWKGNPEASIKCELYSNGLHMSARDLFHWKGSCTSNFMLKYWAKKTTSCHGDPPVLFRKCSFCSIQQSCL